MKKESFIVFIAVSVLLLSPIDLIAMETSDNRQFDSNKFALQIDEESQGFVKKVSGGIIKGEVATHDLGIEVIAKKHLASVTVEPITIETNLNMGKGLYEWIKASFQRQFETHSGKITIADYNFEVPSTLEFQEALITKITIPNMDVGSNKRGIIEVQFLPRITQIQTGDDIQLPAAQKPKSKTWLASNFRLEIGDLPTSRVSKIDSFTWKLAVTKDEVGQFRFPSLTPTKVEVPNLKITVSMADLGEWNNWHKDFVIDGKCTDGDEQCSDEGEISGSITFLDPDLETELARIELLGIGIISIDTLGRGQEANKEEVARFSVELYVEDMKFNIQHFENTTKEKVSAD